MHRARPAAVTEDERQTRLRRQHLRKKTLSLLNTERFILLQQGDRSPDTVLLSPSSPEYYLDEAAVRLQRAAARRLEVRSQL